MNAAILCPGPSLLTATIPPHELLIGVNRAPVILEKRGIQVHAWVMSEGFRMADHAPSYPVDICTTLSAMDRMHRRRKAFVPAAKTVTKFEDMQTRFPREWKWSQYSFTAAIVFAAWRGATAIDCIGCDMTNAPDADGVSLPTNRRNEQRWEQERGIFDTLVKELGTLGIALQRLTT